MRTTLIIDDSLYRAVTSLARNSEGTISETVNRLLKKALTESTPNHLKNGVPVFEVTSESPIVTPEQIKAAEDE